MTSAPARSVVRTWAAAPQDPPSAIGFDESLQRLADTTLHQLARISSGGTGAQILISNRFGTQPLRIGAAAAGLVGRQGDRRTVTRPLTFAGATTVLIPPGGAVHSDPLDVLLPPLSVLSVGLHLPEEVPHLTCHGTSTSNGWRTPGDTTACSTRPRTATALGSQALMVGIDLISEQPTRSVVTIGDSLTNGAGSTAGAWRSWPDLLAEQALRHGRTPVAVANQGISGNRVLTDGHGASALSRFDQDVLAVPGVETVIIVEGINDIGLADPDELDRTGSTAFSDALIAAYRLMINRAHESRLQVLLATLTPFGGSAMDTSRAERTRLTVNDWIRNAARADGVLDFDAAWRDPGQPARIRESLHAGDHLHGNDHGYQALANSIDLELLTPAAERAPKRQNLQPS